MLLFVSDLHLATGDFPATMDVWRFLRVLDEILSRSRERGVERARLVLLGDVFEILKAREWIAAQLRPWEKPTPAHGQVVTSVFDAVETNNRAFFTGLGQLTSKYSWLSLVYVPGNHDRELNESIGDVARRRLQSLLPLGRSDGQRFSNYFIDEEHLVLAKHGHEWDDLNRTGPSLGALGDVVVLELILQLPGFIAEALGLDERDRRLEFLHEIDNVRPHHPRVLLEWIFHGLESLSEEKEASKAIRKALGRVADSLSETLARHSFEGSASRAERRIARALIRTLRTPIALPLLARLPENAADPNPDFALDDLAGLTGSRDRDGGFRMLLAGHTHLPKVVPLEAGLVPPPLYVNTGTWRRVHVPVHGSRRGQTQSFATWVEEIVTCVFSPDEVSRGLPSYEIHRFHHGDHLAR